MEVERAARDGGADAGLERMDSGAPIDSGAAADSGLAPDAGFCFGRCGFEHQVDVSAASFACGRFPGGRVACWGSNISTQLGRAEPDYTNRPLFVPGVAGAESVSVGRDHACALLASGEVMCWGSNLAGQMAVGAEGGAYEPHLIPRIDDAIEVKSAENYSCVIHRDRTVSCWGNASNGQSASFFPQPVESVSAAEKIELGANRACALTSLGNIICWDSSSAAEDEELIEDAIDLAVGRGHACALLRSGMVACWGDGETYATGEFVDLKTPTLVREVSGIEHISAKNNSTGAVDASGAMRFWGENYGFVAGERNPRISRAKILAPDYVAEKFAVGSAVACAIGAADTIDCWGDNYFGAAGRPALAHDEPRAIDLGGARAAALSFRVHGGCAATEAGEVFRWGYFRGSWGTPPEKVAGINDAVRCEHGTGFACALLRGGRVACWGVNTSGQLGSASMGDVAEVELLPPVVELSVGQQHACARTNAGEVWCWGANTSKQLGRAGSGGRVPQLVEGVHADALSAGDRHTCVLDAGEVWCWGENSSQQLGRARSASSSVAASIAELEDAIAVRAGHDHSCAIRSDGRAWCWGGNEHGQLGDGTTAGRAVPQPVSDLEDVAELAAGDHFSCAADRSGEALCWGRKGEYAIGSPQVGVTMLLPERQPQLSGVAKIAAGAAEACAIDGEQHLSCWGTNRNCSSGICEPTYSSVPETISAPTD